jgi:hypothetical protein
VEKNMKLRIRQRCLNRVLNISIVLLIIGFSSISITAFLYEAYKIFYPVILSLIFIVVPFIIGCLISGDCIKGIPENIYEYMEYYGYTEAESSEVLDEMKREGLWQ